MDALRPVSAAAGESAGREAWERGEKYNTELSSTAIALSG